MRGNAWFGYPHKVNNVCSGAAVIGGFVYRMTAFPAAFQGAYFWAEYAIGGINYFKLDANNNPVLPSLSFDNGAYGIINLKPGPNVSPGAVATGPAESSRMRYTDLRVLVCVCPPCRTLTCRASCTPLTRAATSSATCTVSCAVLCRNIPASNPTPPPPPATPPTCAASGCVYLGGPCNCDNLCVSYGDCCADYSAACLGVTTTTPAPAGKTVTLIWNTTVGQGFVVNINVGDSVAFVWGDDGGGCLGALM